jgi:hypothetical protein
MKLKSNFIMLFQKSELSENCQITNLRKINKFYL